MPCHIDNKNSKIYISKNHFKIKIKLDGVYQEIELVREKDKLGYTVSPNLWCSLFLLGKSSNIESDNENSSIASFQIV